MYNSTWNGMLHNFQFSHLQPNCCTDSYHYFNAYFLNKNILHQVSDINGYITKAFSVLSNTCEALRTSD